MATTLPASLKTLVRQRAGDRCEYCRLPQEALPLARFHIEHITPRAHGGSDDPANLALACSHCNWHKGTNLSGIDPLTTTILPLFHPRTDRWTVHFAYRGAFVIGRTPTGRATVHVLNMNDGAYVQIRTRLLARGELG